MANMGRYCKAYALQDLRAFEGWTENSQNARREKKQMDGKEVEIQRSWPAILCGQPSGEFHSNRRHFYRREYPI